MPLHVPQSQEKNDLKNLRRALKTGEAVTIANTYDDQSLIELLQEFKRPTSNFQVALILYILLLVMVPMGEILHIGTLFVFLAIVGLPILLILWVSQTKIHPRSLESLQARLEDAAISTLLQAYDLNIPDLKSAIQAGLIKQLGTATAEELRGLTPTRRQLLVRFTLDQFTPQESQFAPIPEANAQAATLGYLALATLRQKGAEYPYVSLFGTLPDNLQKSIDEYQSVMRSP